MVGLIEIFDQGPCGTFQIMKDHYNDIEHYTPLAIHVVSINTYCVFAKNYSPYGILHPMKDHYIDVEVFTSLTVHVVSRGSNSCLTINNSPCGTFQVMREYFRIYS